MGCQIFGYKIILKTIIPTLFPNFLPFTYPYILLHFDTTCFIGTNRQPIAHPQLLL